MTTSYEFGARRARRRKRRSDGSGSSGAAAHALQSLQRTAGNAAVVAELQLEEDQRSPVLELIGRGGDTAGTAPANGAPVQREECHEAHDEVDATPAVQPLAVQRFNPPDLEYEHLQDDEKEEARAAEQEKVTAEIQASEEAATLKREQHSALLKVAFVPPVEAAIKDCRKEKPNAKVLRTRLTGPAATLEGMARDADEGEPQLNDAFEPMFNAMSVLDALGKSHLQTFTEIRAELSAMVAAVDKGLAPGKRPEPTDSNTEAVEAFDKADAYHKLVTSSLLLPVRQLAAEVSHLDNNSTHETITELAEHHQHLPEVYKTLSQQAPEDKAAAFGVEGFMKLQDAVARLTTTGMSRREAFDTVASLLEDALKGLSGAPDDETPEPTPAPSPSPLPPPPPPPSPKP